MKQPNLNDLEVDVQGTKRIRSKMAKAKKVKITINLDEDVLELVKQQAEESGTPYQSLINRLIRGALIENKEEAKRIDRIERELEALKKKVG